MLLLVKTLMILTKQSKNILTRSTLIWEALNRQKNVRIIFNSGRIISYNSYLTCLPIMVLFHLQIASPWATCVIRPWKSSSVFTGICFTGINLTGICFTGIYLTSIHKRGKINWKNPLHCSF